MNTPEGIDSAPELWLLLFVPFCLIGFAIQAVVCWLVSGCFQAIPEKHRRMEPGAVWLLMIPLFPLVWNFFVYPRLAESYRSFFDEHRQEIDPGSCGRELAFGFATSTVVCIPLGWIPCLGGLLALALLGGCRSKAHRRHSKPLARWFPRARETECIGARGVLTKPGITPTGS